jgi:hypothetical protein
MQTVQKKEASYNNQSKAQQSKMAKNTRGSYALILLLVSVVFGAFTPFSPQQAQGQGASRPAKTIIHSHESTGSGSLQDGMASIQNVPIESDPDGGYVTYVEPLQPTYDAAFVIPDIQLEYYSDGSIAVASGTTDIQSGQTQAFQVDVDTQAHTYRTTYLYGGTPMQAANARWIDFVALRTVDPPGYFLAQTNNFIDYTVDNYGRIVGWLWSDRCFWANPTCLNTHWNNNRCSNDEIYFTEGNINNEAYSKYTNWDFGNVNSNTVVKHWTRIEAFPNGRGRVYHRHKTKGEYYFLLSYQLWINQEPAPPKPC